MPNFRRVLAICYSHHHCLQAGEIACIFGNGTNLAPLRSRYMSGASGFVQIDFEKQNESAGEGFQ